MASTLAGTMRGLNAVAMGDKKADLLIRDCRLISVYTGEVIEGSEIAIKGDRIAYVGPDASHAAGPSTRTFDAGGLPVCPGLADPHTHIDQFVLPSELAGQALLCGVTSLFSDPIDMVSVAGRRGFAEFLRLGEGLPARIFQTIPGGLPVDPKFSNSAALSPAQQRAAVRHPHVIGMGEVFSWTKVTGRDGDTMDALAAMLERDCPINGHTAGASGRKLNAYVASGILSCHEPVNFEQVLERLRLGMWVMIREGSIRRDLAEIVPRVLSEGVRLDRLMFCSDGLDPPDIAGVGHIDHCIREAVRLGMRPAEAVMVSSRNVFDYYNMGRDLGGIAPGKLADILVLDDLESFRPRHVFVGGRQAVAGGRLVSRIAKRRIPAWMRNTVRPGRISAGDFEVRAKGATAEAATIFLRTEIITGIGSAELRARDGLVRATGEVWKVAAFDRAHGTRRRCVGFLENFGAEIGAFASTWSFHENDLVVMGSDESDMALACGHLARCGGGMAVVRDGRVVSSMPLPVAGIVSSGTFEGVRGEFEGLVSSITDAGCTFQRPHLVPLFLPFLALPSVRITSGGIVDVKARRYVSPIGPIAK